MAFAPVCFASCRQTWPILWSAASAMEGRGARHRSGGIRLGVAARIRDIASGVAAPTSTCSCWRRCSSAILWILDGNPWQNHCGHGVRWRICPQPLRVSLQTKRALGRPGGRSVRRQREAKHKSVRVVRRRMEVTPLRRRGEASSESLQRWRKRCGAEGPELLSAPFGQNLGSATMSLYHEELGIDHATHSGMRVEAMAWQVAVPRSLMQTVELTRWPVQHMANRASVVEWSIGPHV